MTPALFKPGDVVSIDNDHWDDKQKFVIKEIYYRPNSNAIEVELVDTNNNTHKRVLPYSQLYEA